MPLIFLRLSEVSDFKQLKEKSYCFLPPVDQIRQNGVKIACYYVRTFVVFVFSFVKMDQIRDQII